MSIMLSEQFLIMFECGIPLEFLESSTSAIVDHTSMANCAAFSYCELIKVIVSSPIGIM